MATIPQIQKGLTAFVDRYVAGAYTGVEKAIVLGGTALISSNLANVVRSYAEHPIVAALGVYDQEAGVVNVDALYDAFVPNLGSDKIPITLPKMGSINLGTIKLGKEELDSLYRCIKEA